MSHRSTPRHPARSNQSSDGFRAPRSGALFGRRVVAAGLMVAGLTLGAGAALPALAADPGTALPAPTGEVVLTVTGKIARTNGDGAASFDMEMLKALPAVSFETETIWTKGSQSFVGVELKTLVEELGIEGEILGASAINDYRVDIPLSDAIENGPIVAYTMNGQAMSRRDKGPLWIVYPYGSDAKYRTEAIYNRSIWQLVTLVAE